VSLKSSGNEFQRRQTTACHVARLTRGKSN